MDPDLELTGFEGVCRLFPLPEVVLFPNCVVPLHIFEPRYRQMTEDALAGDRLIAMVRLRGGADSIKEVDPPIDPVACLGKIFDHQRLADGRFNILLVGMARVRLLRELPKDRLYRQAEAEIIEDIEPEAPPQGLRDELVGLFREVCAREGKVEPEIARLLEKPIPLGVLSDLLGHYMGLPSAVKAAFLAEARVEQRTRRLVEVLRGHLGRSPGDRADGDQGFPPPFSVN